MDDTYFEITLMYCLLPNCILALFLSKNVPSRQSQKGFTFIELIITVAIISILFTISVSSYHKYLAETQQGACLSEAKNYSNKVFYELNDQDISTSPIAPNTLACQSMTDATGWTLETQQEIIAIAKPPSNARIECNIPNGAPCRILP